MRRLFFCLMALMGVLTLSAQSVYENEVINNIMTRVWLLLFVAIWTRRCRARHRSIGFRTARQPQKISSLQLKPLVLVPYGQAAILWTTALLKSPRC